MTIYLAHGGDTDVVVVLTGGSSRCSIYSYTAQVFLLTNLHIKYYISLARCTIPGHAHRLGGKIYNV